MKQLKYYCLLVAFCITSCSQPTNLDLSNTFWVTDFAIEEGAFIPNLVLSIGDSIASVHQFGTGEELFELSYQIKENDLYLDGKAIPFMKFVAIKSDQMRAVTAPGDTMNLSRVSPSSISKERLQQQLFEHSFLWKTKEGERIVYFDEKEVIEFPKLGGKSNRSKLLFKRLPYYLDGTKGVLTLMLGDPSQVTTFCGMVQEMKTGQFEITMFGQDQLEQQTMTRIPRKKHLEKEFIGEWKLGGRNDLVFQFNAGGKVTFYEQELNKQATWKLDDSGHLIIIEEPTRQKRYAIKNFQANNKIITLELQKGKFSDLLQF